MKRNALKGFTLIELLVVLAVITGLLVVSWPALQQARANAHTARCLGNLRACGQAILAHAQENQAKLVLPWASNLDSDTGRFPELVGHPQSGLNWYSYLIEENYLSRDATVCPAFTPHRFTVKPWGQTYGMRRTADIHRYKPISLRNVERPAHYVVLADSSRPTLAKPSQWYYITYPGNAIDTMHFRHASRANILFLDGSSRGLTTEEVLDLSDGWNSRAFDLLQ